MRAPAMTPTEIATSPLEVPRVRVTCYACPRTLFVGDADPQGGADAVFDAAGCRDEPATCPGQNPDAYPDPAIGRLPVTPAASEATDWSAVRPDVAPADQ